MISVTITLAVSEQF